MEFEFVYVIRTLRPTQGCAVTVTAVIEREDGPCEVGYAVPMGVSGEAMAKLALDHYHVIGRAWELWREAMEGQASEAIAGERSQAV